MMSNSFYHLGIRAMIVVAALGCAFALGASAARAADTYRVVNVRPGDELNVRAGPDAGFPVLGTLARGATGVEGLGDCARRWCPVRSGFVLGWASARFLEREPGSEQAVQGEALAALGVVLDDGTLERTLPDGRRVRRLPSGSEQTVWPDGRTTQAAYANAPGSGLPALPPELSGWAGRVSDGLLTVLGNILTNEEMEAYLQTEAGRNLVELLDWRLRSIRFLTTPAS